MRPVRCSSMIPNGCNRSEMASSFCGAPATWMVRLSWPTSSMRAWKIDASSVICDRRSAVAFTVTSISSRSTASSGCSSAILSTGISLLSCLVICSSGAESASTTIVIRLNRSSSVGLTANDTMLNPRRANRPATRESTPNLFSTSTLRMWCCATLMVDSAASSRSSAFSPSPSVTPSGTVVRGVEDHVVVRRSGRDHRVHLLPVVGAEVDHHRTVVDVVRLLDRGLHLLRRVDAHPDAAHRLGPLHVVGEVRREVHLAVPLLVEELLPLPHHAQVGVVEDGDLDRDALRARGHQLLGRHLEAAVAVDRPHHALGLADLRADGGRHC